MLNLYKNIRQRRLALGITQKELSERLGYKSVSTIAKIEAGRSDLPQSKIKAFADALGTSIDDLMGEVAHNDNAVVLDSSSNGRDILKALCKDRPQALALIDRLKVTGAGDVVITGVDAGSAKVIGYAFRGAVAALDEAELTGDNSMEIVIS